MHKFGIVGAALVLLAGGSEIASDQGGEVYDFGGVFDGTYAGEIYRTVEPRRPDGPPNVVLIIADDLGWPYLGFLGDENVITPNMDIFGRGGAVFERGYATSNHCRPTLQSLITGLHPVQYKSQATASADQNMADRTLPEGADTERERGAFSESAKLYYANTAWLDCGCWRAVG